MNLKRSHVCRLITPCKPWETLGPPSSEGCPCLPDCMCGMQGASAAKTWNPEESWGGGVCGQREGLTGVAGEQRGTVAKGISEESSVRPRRFPWESR